MTSYERGWYFWLRRELAAELGVPAQQGRPRALTKAQEARVYAEVTATKVGRRCFTLSRLARELNVSVQTLERVVAGQRAKQRTDAPVGRSQSPTYQHSGSIPIAEPEPDYEFQCSTRNLKTISSEAA